MYVLSVCALQFLQNLLAPGYIFALCRFPQFCGMPILPHVAQTRARMLEQV